MTSTDRDLIAHELAFYVGKTMKLASADLPYGEVIAHIGEPPPHHQEALAAGEGAASLYPDSRLFSEITFYLGEGEREDRIYSMEFVSTPGSYDMDDLAAAFGAWQRSPREPEEVSFAVAWFPEQEALDGARMFLHAEDREYGPRIDPGTTPYRLFFQAERFRWGD